MDASVYCLGRLYVLQYLHEICHSQVREWGHMLENMLDRL